jgi:hypothetical protein
MKNVDRPKLKAEEIEKKGKLLKSIMDRKKTEKVDVKSTFDLIHLSIYPLLENREIVEEDMKQLKTTLDDVAGRIVKIIEKSKGKPSRKIPK